jgi:uncharacterized protein (DUF2249 family)
MIPGDAMREPSPNVIDISPLEAVDRYPAIRRCFDRLGVGQRLWIVTDREPGLFLRRLRKDRAGCFRWDSARQARRIWVVAILKEHEPLLATEDSTPYWRSVVAPVIDHLPAPPPAPESAPAVSVYEQLRQSAAP